LPATLAAKCLLASLLILTGGAIVAAQAYFEEVWSVSIDGASANDPVVADVFATGELVLITSDIERSVKAYNLKTGQVIWSASTPAERLTSPSVGAFSNDGAYDVTVASKDPAGKALYVLEGSTGDLIATMPLPNPAIYQPTAFPLAREEGIPQRHGLAFADATGRPYLLELRFAEGSVANYRQISEATMAAMSGLVPTGPPATGNVLSDTSTDIVFASARMVAVLEREGTQEHLYRVPRSEKAEINTMPIVANVRQNARTDARDWDEIVFGLYNAESQKGYYYVLEYQEFSPKQSEHYPFASHWGEARDSFENTPYDPITANWDRDDQRLELLLASQRETKGFDGLGNRTFFQSFSQGQLSSPVALIGKAASAVLMFDRGTGNMVIRRSPTLSGSPENYTLPLAPTRVPIVGDLINQGDNVAEILLIGQDKMALYRVPQLVIEGLAGISSQTRGGSIYRNGSYTAALLREDEERRTLLQARTQALKEEAVAAASAGKLEEARAAADGLMRIDPNVEGGHSLLRGIKIRQNLIGLIFGGLAILAFLGSAGYFLFRIYQKSSGLKNAEAHSAAGRSKEALDILHWLRVTFPRDPRVLEALALTIVRHGAYDERSIEPLEQYHAAHDSSAEVSRTLALCHITLRRTDPRLLPLYRKAEDLLPGNAALRYLIGKIYRDQGDQRLAAESLRAAVKLDDPPDEAWVELADILLNSDQANARNLNVFEKAFQIQGDDVGFLKGLCLAMIDAKRVDLPATRIYEKMLAHDRTYIPALLQLAQAKIQGGQIEEAIVHAHKIQQLDPNNEQGVQLLSQGYLIQGRTDDAAIRTFRRAVELFPKDKEVLTALARTFVAQKRADEEAVGYYRRAYEVNANDPEIAKTIAKVAWAQKDWGLIIRSHEKLNELGQGNPKLTAQLAEAYVSTDMREERGEKVLREAIKAEPSNRRLLTHLSRIFITGNRVDAEAMKVYAQAYKEAPSYDIGRMLVKAWYHNDQYEDISNLAPKLLQQKPDDDELQKIYAQANIASNRMDDAIAQYETMFANNPEDREAIINLAQAYAQKGQTDEKAIGFYRKALEISPNLDVLWNMMGRLSMKAGNQDEAIRCFKQALKVAPTKVERVIREVQLLLTKDVEAVRLRWLQVELLIYSNRLREASEELSAIFMADPGQLPLVIQGYDKVLEKDPRNLPGLVARGRLYQTSGRFEEARRDLEQAFHLNASFADAQRGLVELYLAMLAENDDIEVRHRLGIVYMRMEEYDKAIGAFQRSSQDYRLENEAAKLLGQCFVAKGMLDLALQQFKRLSVDDDLKEILYDLGQRYEQKKDMIGAKTVYKTLFAADISYKDVKTKFEGMAGTTSDPMVFEKTVMQAALSPEAQRRYELQKELGRGAMGIVYKAKDNELDEIVALKILPESISNNPEAVRRFRIEARSARRLAHPHIVRIHDIGEEMGRKFISMEYVEGTDLKARFRAEGPPGLKLLSQWCMDVASALAYAHRMGIVHRDIKPANIMITDDGVVKVADFGIAKNMGAADATMTGAVMGTPLYMSPEQVRGEQIDHRADIYSFGIMLYELTAGRPPFTEGDLAYQHINVDPKPLDGIEPRWAELVMRCLAKKREDRWDSLDVLIEYLRPFRDQLI